MPGCFVANAAPYCKNKHCFLTICLTKEARYSLETLKILLEQQGGGLVTQIKALNAKEYASQNNVQRTENHTECTLKYKIIIKVYVWTIFMSIISIYNM